MIGTDGTAFAFAVSSASTGLSCLGANHQCRGANVTQ